MYYFEMNFRTQRMKPDKTAKLNAFLNTFLGTFNSAQVLTISIVITFIMEFKPIYSTF